MSERIVYINGKFVPESAAKISIFDRGFQYGDAVFDTARTFGHRPYKLKEHLERLYRSLQYVRIDPGLSMAEMERLTLEVLAKNLPFLEPHDDYWVTQQISRGTSMQGPAQVIIYCIPLPFASYAKYYKTGVHLVIPSTRRTPPQCLDGKAKSTSRLNLVLADLEAKQVDPEAFALLLDLEGNIAEGTGYNVFMVKRGKLFTPVERGILAGVSRETVFELAEELRIPLVETDLQPYDLYTADEVFITGTSRCLAPASRLNGVRIGGEIPGEISQLLLKTWSNKVGVDIVEQALSHLPEAERAKLAPPPLPH